jgi:dTDP-glucose 4,6-dehydratase
MNIDDGRVIPNFLRQALLQKPLTIYGDGTQTRSFCYVDDMVQGIYKLLLTDEHNPINIGNPSEISILELAHLINALIGNKAGIKFVKNFLVQATRTDENRISLVRARS